jgi:polar amino acid transport system ATP-binding protein
MAAGMNDVVLNVRGLTVRRENRAIVENVSIEVPKGQLLALMGASGAGKTTVLRAIAGLDTFAGGEINLQDVRLVANGLSPREVLRELHRRVGIVFQFHNLFVNLTAAHNVWLALVHVYGMPRNEAESKAAVLLESLGVSPRAKAYPHELSGGEAQRVAIARALAVDPPLLLMDEPTASLDGGRRLELASTLRDLVAQGRTLIVATHDAEFARACAQRVVLLGDGRIKEDGSTTDVIK